MEPPGRKHFRDPEIFEPLGKRPTLQRQEYRQDPFILAKRHVQEFATRWASDSRLLQLIYSTSQNREFPRRFQQYYVNNRTQVATISVLKAMVCCVKAALQRNSTLQTPSEHLEGAIGIMFSDYVVEELRWLQNNAPT